MKSFLNNIKNLGLPNKKIFWWLLFGAIIFAWCKFRFDYLTIRTGDTWIYWYAGKEILEGNLPYQDFFYSSPPLIPYLTALWQWLFGFNLKVALIVPHLLTIISGFLIFIFFSLKEKYQAGIVAAIAFLFAGVVFVHADFLLGSNIILPFIIAGFLFFDRKKFFLAGIFFGLAALTKLYGIIPAIFLLPFLKNRKDFFNFALGGLISFGVPNLIFLSLLGGKYIDLIFFNHFQKDFFGKLDSFIAVLKNDTALLLTLLLGIFWSRKEPAFRYLVCAGLGLIIFLSIFSEIFYPYFQPLIAISALVLGYFLIKKDLPWSRFALPAIFITLVFNSLQSVWNYYKVDCKLGQLPEFDQMLQVVKHTTKVGDPIYGISGLTPLLALESDREIFENYFDNYAKWESVGIFSSESRLREVAEDRVPLIITSENRICKSQICSDGTLLPKKFLLRNCQIEQKFGYNEFTFWSCFAKP